MDQGAVVIAGAGAAGVSAAVSMRTGGFAGSVTLINGVPHQPCNRTLVNKGILPGLLTVEQVAQRGTRALKADLIHARAAAVDKDRSILKLEDGRTFTYAALIAATGSLPCPDSHVSATSDRVFHLHTADDAARLRTQLGENAASKTVTVLDAGYTGAEAASFLAEAGVRVHLVFRAISPLASALSGPIAQRITQLHRRNINVYFDQHTTAFSPGPASVTITLGDGRILESDFVVIAPGTTPSTAWLTGDDNGVAVDSRLRALDNLHVYAAGSLALLPARDGEIYRMDHWEAAVAQGAHAARAVLHDLTGAPDPGPYTPDTGFTLTSTAIPRAHLARFYRAAASVSRKPGLYTNRPEGPIDSC